VIEALIEAAKLGDESAVREIVARTPGVLLQRLPSGESPLMAALYRGHLGIVAALIELGTEVDVFAAAATGRLAELTKALDHPGAINAFSFDGWTPLHLASFFGQRDACRTLLDAGAAVQALSRNSLRNTPLHAAVAGRHTEVGLLLLERGADPSIRDGGGCTPRLIAEENELTAVVDAMKRRLEGR
jgi:uncharacterized protein